MTPGELETFTPAASAFEASELYEIAVGLGA